ncbi:TRAP transporter small permease [uncultured Cohaesibacter sp.]|uniref:TRAP transporter small permease subunit n=1 Tax=uncultured Cohaesibacter sp. TaxID=1002546 RepID=UPI002AAAAE93|nr:TRAP transporter small permease [uncultured Cohaesibacter sp.]
MTGLEKPNEEASIADHKKPPKACPEAGLFGRIVNRMGIIFSVGILVSAGILFIEVVMRYVFNSPTTWAHETVVFLNACAFIFGGLYVAAHNKHIRVVLVYSMIPDGPRRYLDAVISFVCMVSTGFFAFASWSSIQRAIWTPQGQFHLETSGSAWNPPFPGTLKVFLFVIMIALTIQFFIYTLKFAFKAGAK